ncbi:hypothetical protein pb186bvf_012170 [Paramecium bursaria]
MQKRYLLVQFLIFTSVQIISFQLLFDPWCHERYERMWRENARLFNPILQFNDRIDFTREALAILGIASSFLYFMGSKFFGQLTILWGFLYWLVHFNFQLLLSERFCYVVLQYSIAYVGLALALLKTL